MNWKWKARIQNVVAGLPMSDRLYYAMQRTVGSFRPGRMNPAEWLDAAASMAEWIRSAGHEVSGRRFLEVGTGHHVSVPLSLWLCGAAQIVTVDLNTYLSEALVMEAVAFVRQNQEQVIKIFGAEAEAAQFQERLQRIVNFSGSLSDFLRLVNTAYLSPADAGVLDFPDQSFDFHVSHAVFEHIPPETITALLAEARRLLKPQGLLMHIIDPSDHFSHDDASITAINFLQFSDEEWKRWAGNKFMYHNRLRAFEYLKLFEEAGVRILRQSQAMDEPSLKSLNNGFRLDRQFRQMVPEELAVRGLILMGTFSTREPDKGGEPQAMNYETVERESRGNSPALASMNPTW